MVVAKKKKAEIAVDDLVKDVRVAYSNFRSSWFEFAGLITKVHDDEAWTKLGHCSFKEYCLVEFSDMNYSTIIKFVSVMHSHLGRLLGSKVDKDPKASLPAWETCYQLQIAEKRLPEDELPNLYKDVLDGKASLNRIKQKIKDINKRIDAVVPVAAESDVFDIDDEDVDVGDDVETDIVVDEVELQAASLIDSTKRMTKSLKSLTPKLSETTDMTVKLAEFLYDKFVPVLNGFIDKMEMLSQDADDETESEELESEED